VSVALLGEDHLVTSMPNHQNCATSTLGSGLSAPDVDAAKNEPETKSDMNVQAAIQALTSFAGPRARSPRTQPHRTNTAPMVAITSPASESTFSAPATIAIGVDATDSDGTIA